MPTPSQAYRYQKNVARQRDISWELTYETWSAWWLAQLGPNWFQLRGRKAGQYVMSRPGDVGPYSLENIKCILHTENTKEAAARMLKGVRKPKTMVKAVGPRPYIRIAPGPKLSQERILAIRAMSGSSAAIARQFGLSQSWVWRIRNERAA